MSGSSGSQSSQAREVPNGISPILLKHFNVYEPLTPKKVVNSPNGSLNEDLLIDFESPIEVKRTVEKEDEGFDVIDLFQNIYVTPELVNSKPKTKTETDVDYEDFLRKFESRNKILTQNPETIVPPKNSLLDLDFTHLNEISETQNRPETNINDSNKISLSVETMSSYNNEVDEYQEELIEEILLDRTLEKLKLSGVKNDQISKNMKVLMTPNISNNNISQLYDATNLVLEQTFSKTQDPKTDPNWKRDIIPNLNLNNHDLKDRSVTNYNQNITKQENFNVLGLKHTISNNNNFQSTSSKISNSISSKQIPLVNQLMLVSEKSFHINQHQNIINACSSTDRHCDENAIPARNYKILNDNSNQREDTLRNAGILHLKTPQQNHRITHDYMHLYAKTDQHSNNCEILTRNHNNKSDNCLSDSKNLTNYANLNITPKCMNDNLRELKSTVNDSQSKSFISDITTLLHLTVDPGEMKTVSVQAVIKDKEYAKSHKTKSNAEKLTYSKGPDLNEKSIVLPHLLSRLSEQKNKRDEKKNLRKRLLLYPGSAEVKTFQDQASVEFKPTILKEDCNKERLIAFKTRQSLSNLVQSGNIF